MKIKKLFVSIFMLLVALTLVACGKSDADLVKDAKAKLEIGYSTGDTASNVVGRLILPVKVDKVVITWASSNEDVVKTNGVVTAQEEDVEVTLTATLELNDEKDTKTFKVTVKAEEENSNGGETPTVQLPEAFNNAAEGKKVYLTTIGQGGELSTLQVILSRYVYGADEAAEYNSKFTQNATLKASDVEEGSIVILVPGASGKGLGAAGTNIPNERSRAEAFGARAEAGEITIYVVHLGGQSRRGESDTLITASVAHASLVMIEQEGNSDDFFTNMNLENFFEYAAAAAMVDSFKQIFNKE